MSFTNGTPHVNFEINKDMDYWAAKEFLSFDPDDTFSNGILNMYPELKKALDVMDDEKISFYNNFVDMQYKELSPVLEDKKLSIQSEWDKVESLFLETTTKLFKGHTWPTGSYVGFLSIFNCNPRFLNQKTFQVYFKHEEGPIYVCAHEMLHFMFYDYVGQHKELVEKLTENQLWKLSELFNVVLLETTDFSDITGNTHPKAYKSHELLIPDFRELWKASKDTPDFIHKAASKLQ